jgi:hypothetical protein
VLRDLDLSLAEIPDESLGADFAYLAQAARDDLALPASAALAKLHALRHRLLRTGGARMFLASSGEMRGALAPQIEAFAARLDATTPVRRAVPLVAEAPIGARLRGRGAPAAPLHVGLHAPNKQGGRDHHHGARVRFADAADREKLLDFLASRLYGGGGSHGVFSKTVGAGLAYSNGLRGSVSLGQMGYYAERTPELPQTVRFVTGVIKDGQARSRPSASTCSRRPSPSRAPRRPTRRAPRASPPISPTASRPRRCGASAPRCSRCADEPRFVDELYERKDRVYARLLPGYDAKGSTGPRAASS